MRWLAANSRGRGVEIAVIDSGIDGRHPELAGRVKDGCSVAKDSRGNIVIRETAARKCVDPFGHGTAVAGIITDLAPNAKVVSVKVLDDYNSCTGDIMIAGLKWALDRQFRVINMSLTTSKPLWIPKLQELCEQAHVQNSIIVAARRNFGDFGCPARFTSVISVDRQDYVDKLRIHYRPKDVIQFEARGTGIKVLAPGGRHAIQTGTSFATPHVAGMVALLLELFPHLTAVEAKAALKAFSDRHRPNHHSKGPQTNPARLTM